MKHDYDSDENKWMDQLIIEEAEVNKLRKENQRLTDLVTNLEQTNNELKKKNDFALCTAYICGHDSASKDYKDLLKAATNTLKDNLRLADGDNCTLYELREAVRNINPNWNEEE